ncbi:MAG: hypothetical protein HWD90_13315 [Campylobacteraceae bacterium]|nr:hypothetical protein [Campylobacteraceae bacterium]
MVWFINFGSEDRTIVARPYLPIDENGKLYNGVEEELIEIIEEYLKV